MPKLPELSDFANGLYRIGVCKTDLLSWRDFKGMIPAPLAESHEICGRQMGGNPDEWYVDLKPVSSDRWVAVEKWDDQTQSWFPVNLGDAEE